MKNPNKLLTEIACVIRSKNAGPYELTLDIIFNKKKDFLSVRKSGFFTKKKIAGLYSVQEPDVKKIIYFEPARALKITVSRQIVSGGAGDSDVYGAQQHGPLLSLRIPL